MSMSAGCQPKDKVSLRNESESSVKVTFGHFGDADAPYVVAENLAPLAVVHATVARVDDAKGCDATGFLLAVAADGRTAQFGPPVCQLQRFHLDESQLRAP